MHHSEYQANLALIDRAEQKIKPMPQHYGIGLKYRRPSLLTRIVRFFIRRRQAV